MDFKNTKFACAHGVQTGPERQTAKFRYDSLKNCDEIAIIIF